MLNGTFDHNADIFSFEYHHEPLNAFQMMICERIPCHNDDTDRNEDPTNERKENYSNSV